MHESLTYGVVCLLSSEKALKQRESNMFIKSREEAGRITHGEVRFYDLCRILSRSGTVSPFIKLPACPSPVTPKVAVLPVRARTMGWPHGVLCARTDILLAQT